MLLKCVFLLVLVFLAETTANLNTVQLLHQHLFGQESYRLLKVIKPGGLADFNQSNKGENGISGLRNETFDRSLVVEIKLKLIQIIQLDIRNQMLMTNLILGQRWVDERLVWNPSDFSGYKELQLHPDMVWLPDLVLYNTGNGKYSPIPADKSFFKILLYHNGTIIFEPPAIMDSFCAINMHSFPYDEQCCNLKVFGSWTYSAKQLDLKIVGPRAHPSGTEGYVDLSIFEDSNAVWQLGESPGKRNVQMYSYAHAGPEPYADVTYSLCMKRRSLFYTVNLVMPSAAISFLAVLAFCLPPDSLEKISLSISILLVLLFFLNLHLELSPPSSLVVPLLGKYFLFTTVLIFMSTAGCIYTQHISFVLKRSLLKERRGALKKCARVIFGSSSSRSKVPSSSVTTNEYESTSGDGSNSSRGNGTDNCHVKCEMCRNLVRNFNVKLTHLLLCSEHYRQMATTRMFQKAMFDIRSISDSLKRREKQDVLIQVCKEKGMFIDRILFFAFLTGCVMGGVEIFMHCCLPTPHEEDRGVSANATDFSPIRSRLFADIANNAEH